MAVPDDPWVMYLVLRRDAGLGLGESLAAAAEACVGCADRYEADPLHAERFAAWYATAVRKVVLVARERDWDELLGGLDATAAAPRGEPAVACLPPRLRSQREPLLVRLQAYRAEPDALPPSAPPPPAAPWLPLVVSAAAPMSAGKAMAQAAHAALLAARSPLAASPFLAGAFAAWRAAGFAARAWVAPPAVFARTASLPQAVVVRDAGFTELAPGTPTVLALPPVSSEAALPPALDGAVRAP